MSSDKHYVDDVTIDRIIMNIEGLLAGQVKPLKGDPDTSHYLLMMRKYLDQYITLLRAKKRGRKTFYFDDVAPVSQGQVETWRSVGIPCDDFSEYEKIPDKIRDAKFTLENCWKKQGYYLEFSGLDEDDEDLDYDDFEQITADFYKWDDEIWEAAELLEKNNIFVYRAKVEDD